MASPFNIISNSAVLPVPPPGAHSPPEWLRVKVFGRGGNPGLKAIPRRPGLRTLREERPLPRRGESPGACTNTVLATKPDVLNHNTETVPRLYRQVRKGALYERSLELLRRAKQAHPEVPTKTGLMLGLGEEKEEVLATLQDLAAQGTDILTLGQYLQPTREHLPIVRYVHPDEFAEFKVRGKAMGVNHLEAGPLVRSSYHAFEQTESAVG